VNWKHPVNAQNCDLFSHFFRSLHHKNLIQLLGVVIPPAMSNEPIYVVLEFMTKGALLEYLRSRGRSLVSSADLLKFAK